MEQRHKPVEVVNKLTEAQMRDARMSELSERMERIEQENLELRNMMISLRKEFLKGTKNSGKNKNIDIDQ